MSNPVIYSSARERRILSFIDRDGPAAMQLCAERGLTADAFEGLTERAIYELACELHAKNQLFEGCPILGEEVSRRKTVELAAFMECTEQNPRYGLLEMEVPRLCAEMRRLHQQRQIYDSTVRIADALKENDPEKLSAAMAKLGQTDSSANPRATWAQTASVQTELARAIIEGRHVEETRTIGWPYRSLDLDLKPMRRGELVVVGGFAGLGKSSMMRQMTLAAAMRDQNTAFVSLEVPASDLFNLMAAAKSNQPWSRLKGMHPRDQQDFLVACGDVGRLPVAVLDDTHALAEVTAWLRAQHQRRFLDLVVIDYLGLISECKPEKGQTKAAAVGEVAGSFKRLATELGCVVVIGVQINRGPMNDANRAPRLTDLKDSGDIEAHADRVILLYRPDKDRVGGGEQNGHEPLADRPRYFMEILQEKGRNVGTTSTSLWFRRETAKFELIQK